MALSGVHAGRIAGMIALTAASCTLAFGVQAQEVAGTARWDDPDPVGALINRVNFAADPSAAADIQSQPRYAPGAGWTPERGFAAYTDADIWREGAHHQDRLRLTTRGQMVRADGAPVPFSAADQSRFEPIAYDVRYTRGWSSGPVETQSGLQMDFTPHAGVGMGTEGGSVEAGATFRIGNDLERLVPEGQDAFGERARWYIFAAGSGRAVGYNFARSADGDFRRSGMSHDSGAFLGDASLGVAWRKGDIQGSFGLVYREVEAEGLYTGPEVDNEVDEGLIAFQLSIKPEW